MRHAMLVCGREAPSLTAVRRLIDQPDRQLNRVVHLSPVSFVSAAFLVFNLCAAASCNSPEQTNHNTRRRIMCRSQDKKMEDVVTLLSFFLFWQQPHSFPVVRPLQEPALPAPQSSMLVLVLVLLLLLLQSAQAPPILQCVTNILYDTVLSCTAVRTIPVPY